MRGNVRADFGNVQFADQTHLTRLFDFANLPTDDNSQLPLTKSQHYPAKYLPALTMV